MNVLFVCSMNQWRSPTAEKIYSRHEHISVRSCGTSERAVQKVNTKTIQWSDTIFVMENKHASRIRSKFPDAIRFKEVIVMDIPDDYKFMDEDLIVEIKSVVAPWIAIHFP